MQLQSMTIYEANIQTINHLLLIITSQLLRAVHLSCDGCSAAGFMAHAIDVVIDPGCHVFESGAMKSPLD